MKGILKRGSDGKIIWLENGLHTGRGLAHILQEHEEHFKHKGIPENIILTFILDCVCYGKIVGYQGYERDRPIYEYTYAGKKYLLAITIGDNGFIVGANPRTKLRKGELLK